MKVTGIVAALAIATSAHALAIPQVTVVNAINKLDGVLTNVESLVGNALSCLTGDVDLTQVQTELVAIRTQLQTIAPVNLPANLPTKRDITNTLAGNTAGNLLGTAGGLAAPATNLVAPVEGLAAPVAGEAMNVAGPVVGEAMNVAGPAVNEATGAVGVAGIAGLKRDVSATAGQTNTGATANTGVASVGGSASPANVEALAGTLVSQIQSGAMTATDLSNILSVIYA